MEEFILKHKSDNQGSQSWLNETRNSIGGSSVAYFTGKGYGSLEEFIVNRVFKKEYSNIAMNFGSIMEDVLPKYLNLKYGIENYSLGAVPYLIENEKLMAHYSMDGIFKYNMHNIEPFFEDKEQVCLLEIKFPYSRELKKYKTNRAGIKDSCCIPFGYQDQIKMGLIVIEPCEVGVLTDCFARFCTLDQLKDSKWNQYSPLHTEVKNEIKQILASGVIKIFGTKSRYVNEFDYKNEPIDFGNNYIKIIQIVQEDKKSINELKVEYVLNLGLKEVAIENDDNLLGYIPFKLFDVYFGIVEKDPHFLDDKIERMKKVSELLYNLENLSDEEKIQRLSNLII